MLMPMPLGSGTIWYLLWQPICNARCDKALRFRLRIVPWRLHPSNKLRYQFFGLAFLTVTGINMDRDGDGQIHVMILLFPFKCINQRCRKVERIFCLYMQLSPDIPYKGNPGYFIEEDPALSFRNDADNGNAFRLVKVLRVCSDQDAKLRCNLPVFS